jgi:4-hydroxybutyrate dehydrogenase
MTLPTSQFSIPTNVRFGHGEVSKIAECLESIGSKNPLLMTDGGMLQTSAFKAVEAALNSSGVPWGLFGNVLPNPTEENVEEASGQFRTGEHDALIGFGGGSAIDAAKAVAIRVSFEGALEDYAPPSGKAGHLTPIVAIPTTAGTGSEVGRAAVIVMKKTGQKGILFDPRLMPRIALLDPDLTKDLPPHLTAATGMDAFTHCIESYVCPVFHPVADAIAVGGMELVIQNLPVAVRDGQNGDARGYMAIAAMMGALAFQKDLGAAHAMAHPLSTISGMQHGLANAVVLPYVMAFNLEAAEDRYAKVATLFDPKVAAVDSAEGARRAVGEVVRLNYEIGIPDDLKAAGVKEDDLERLAKAASEDGCRLTNPRPCEADDFRALFRNAYDGTFEN